MLAVALGAAAAWAQAPVVEAVPTDDNVTTINGGPHHSRATASTLTGPLSAAWTVPVRNVTQLLAVPGSLIVIAQGAVESRDPQTGTLRWSAKGAQVGAIVGDTVVVAGGGELAGYALGDGAERWRTGAVGLTSVNEVPVPAGNLVLFQGLGSGTASLRAFDAATGAARWTVATPVPGTPAVVGERVYAAGCGGGFLVLDRATGAKIFTAASSCSGGIAYGARAVGQSVQIGNEVGFQTTNFGGIASVRWQAAVPAVGLIIGDSSVQGIDPLTGAVRWSAKPTAVGGAEAWLAGTTAVVTGGTGVELFDAATGTRTAGGRFANPGSSGGAVPGIVALGSVFVAHGTELTALRPGFTGDKPKLRTNIGASKVIEFGASATVSGRVREVGSGASFIPERSLQLSARGFGGAAATSSVAGATRAADGGTFSFRVTPELYTRYVLRADGATGTKRFQVIVVPRESERIKRSGANRNTITSRITITVPASIPLSGRTYGLYIGRRGSRRYVRVARGRIKKLGEGRGRVTLRFQALTLGRRDFIRSCVSGVSSRGLAFDDRLDRRCGAARIRF